jgi:hypothetical protein
MSEQIVVVVVLTLLVVALVALDVGRTKENSPPDDRER